MEWASVAAKEFSVAYLKVGENGIRLKMWGSALGKGELLLVLL
jgi:hypothetical protein